MPLSDAATAPASRWSLVAACDVALLHWSTHCCSPLVSGSPASGETCVFRAARDLTSCSPLILLRGRLHNRPPNWCCLAGAPAVVAGAASVQLMMWWYPWMPLEMLMSAWPTITGLAATSRLLQGKR